MFSLTRTLSVVALTATAALTSVPALAQDQPGDGVSIRIARGTWDTAWFHTEIYRQMFQELGYEVDEPLTLDAPPFYQSLEQGDLDMWLDAWFPLHASYAHSFEGIAEVVGSVIAGGAYDGYMVDKASAEKYDITSLEDFKREDVQQAFDRDGDGKADLVSCQPGWSCEQVIEHHLDAYGLRDHVNTISVNYNAAMADVMAAMENGEPVLYYTWTPSWTVDELVPGEDAVWIEVPFIDLPEDMADVSDRATLADVQGCVANPCNLGFAGNEIVPVVNSQFLSDNPAIRALLQEASVPLEDVAAQNAQMNAGESTAADLERQAAEWISDHRDTVDGWLATARAAAS